MTDSNSNNTTASPATNSYEVDIRQYADLTAGSPVTANPDFYSMASNTTSLFPVLVNDTEVSPLIEGTLSLSSPTASSGCASLPLNRGRPPSAIRTVRGARSESRAPAQKQSPLSRRRQA